MKKYNYTYKVTEETTGRYYIGVRSSDVAPELDINYKDSMVTWEVDKDNLSKEILSTFKTREKANEEEIRLLIEVKKTNKDILCMNAHIPSVGFCNDGVKWTEKRIKYESRYIDGPSV